MAKKKEEETFSDWLNREPAPYDKEESMKRGKERAEEMTRELKKGLKKLQE